MSNGTLVGRAWLAPDGRLPQSDDLVFTVPVESRQWERWMEVSMGVGNNNPTSVYCRETPSGVRWLNIRRPSGDEISVILWRRMERSVDDIMEAAAWMRLVRGYTHLIFVVPDMEPEPHSIIEHVMGVNPKHLIWLSSLIAEDM